MKFRSSILAAAAIVVVGCGRTENSARESPDQAPARVEQSGILLVFGDQSPQLGAVVCDTVRESDAAVAITAPARVGACCVAGSAGTMVLFEITDLTQLYSDYTKSRAALERSHTQTERLRDLVAHGVTPSKDLTDAEAEHAQAAADLTEKETRLRSAGYDPASLRSASPGTAWVMADVPESQLPLLSRGGTVTLQLAAYPGVDLHGTVEALGDVVDAATRTAKVRVALAGGAHPLRAGMYCTLHVDAVARKGVTVPRGAVVNVQGKSFVFVHTTPSTYTRTEVRVAGEATQDRDVIADGLAAGECVAVQGTMLLKGLSFGY
jgi:cobalt-zinc-cadmium efflux system membrane fusion protein